MQISSKAEKALRLAQLLEDNKKYKEAKSAYRDAIKASDPSDKALIGTLHIDLGNLADKARKPGRAIKYYKKATKILGINQENLF